jgi:hypothetical protein
METPKRIFKIVKVSYFLHELYEVTSEGQKFVKEDNFTMPLIRYVDKKKGVLVN